MIGKSLPPQRLAQIETLLRSATEAVVTARELLQQVGQGASSPRPFANPDGDGTVDALAAFRREMIEPDAGSDASWERLLQERIHARFGRIGNVGSGVLLRLLREPGVFISQKELAEAAGVRSQRSDVVKVYVSHLRTAFARHGVSSDAIETGPKSYALRPSDVPIILDLLTRA